MNYKSKRKEVMKRSSALLGSLLLLTLILCGCGTVIADETEENTEQRTENTEAVSELPETEEPEIESETQDLEAEIGEVSTKEVSEEEEISFVVDEVRENSADFTITNLSSRKLQYGEDKPLEIEIDGTWYKVNMKMESSWDDVALTLQSGGQVSVTLNWGENAGYGELSAGHYRLIKYFNFYTTNENGFDQFDEGFYYACEFDVP